MKPTFFKLNTAKKHSHARMFIVIFAIIAVITGLSISYLIFRSKPANLTSANDSSQTSSAKKEAIEKNEGNIDSSNLPKNSTGITTNQVPESTELKISNIVFSQNEDELSAAAEITGPDTTGTCVFSFKSPEEKPVIKQVQSTAKKCSTTLSRLEFSKLGSWNLSVIRYQGDTKTEATREIQIN